MLRGKKVNKAHLHILTTIKKQINRKASNNEFQISEQIEEHKNDRSKQSTEIHITKTNTSRRAYVAALHLR